MTKKHAQMPNPELAVIAMFQAMGIMAQDRVLQYCAKLHLAARQAMAQQVSAIEIGENGQPAPVVVQPQVEEEPSDAPTGG